MRGRTAIAFVAETVGTLQLCTDTRVTVTKPAHAPRLVLWTELLVAAEPEKLLEMSNMMGCGTCYGCQEYGRCDSSISTNPTATRNRRKMEITCPSGLKVSIKGELTVYVDRFHGLKKRVRVEACLDSQTCATCRAADGSDKTPQCENVTNGTGICRCVERAK